jgi:hypothetical protein
VNHTPIAPGNELLQRPVSVTCNGGCRLIRSIYPELQDHPRTLEYPDVLGMNSNLLLLDHDHPEGGEEEGKSRFNRWEASMALGLAKYLMQQGYGPGEKLQGSPSI